MVAVAAAPVLPTPPKTTFEPGLKGATFVLLS